MFRTSLSRCLIALALVLSLGLVSPAVAAGVDAGGASDPDGGH
jgi:hypothetical protein